MFKGIVKRWDNKKLLKRLGLGVVGIFLLFLLLNRVFPLPDRIDYSTIVTDDKGEVIHAFLTPDQQWRMKTDLTENAIRDTALKTSFVDVKVCAIDETWSGLKLVVRKQLRASFAPARS